MAIKTLMSYRYKISLQYLDTKKNISISFKNECVKYMIIDHNFDIYSIPGSKKVPCMPIIYLSIVADRSMLDDMIKNQNTNLMILALSKYDKNSEQIFESECWRKKCIYFLPDNVNIMDPIDYNDETNDLMRGDTYQSVTLGLIVLEHDNNNRILCEMKANNVSIYDMVRNITSHFNNLIMEPFLYNDVFPQFILPPHDSVRSALEFLNSQRVFYSTPYRFYQDFNYTYLISSSGKAIKRPDERYSSVVINIRDVDDVSANDTGIIVNRDTGTYEVYVSYANTQVFDNSITNKIRTAFKGISSLDDSQSISSSVYGERYQSIRLNNDNTHLLETVQADENMNRFLFYFSKNDLDTDVFSINKRISIHNIQRYQEYNGNYVMHRKREIYLREDDSFVMSSMINLKRLNTDV